MQRAKPGLMVALAMVVGCGSGSDEEPTVTFGLILDMTGSLAHPQWQEAALLAIEHANEGLAQVGDTSGLIFGLEPADSLNLPDTALLRASDLLPKGAKALVMDTTDSAVAVLSTNYDLDSDNDIPLPVVCIACTSSRLGNPEALVPNRAEEAALRNSEHWAFRTSASAASEAMILLKLARTLGDRGDTNRDGTNKLALAFINDLEGTTFSRDLDDARDIVYPNVTVEHVRHEPGIDVDGHSWNDDLVRLTNDRNEELGTLDGAADVVVEVTYPLYGAALTRAYEEAGVEVPFLHHHNWRHDQTLTKLSAFAIDGHEGVSHVLVDNCETSGAIFWEAVQERTGREPSLFDAQTYDAVMLLALATVAAAETEEVSPSAVEPEAIRDALHTLSAIPPGDPRYDAGVEGQRLVVAAGAGGFADAVEAIRAGVPIDYAGTSGPVDFDSLGNVRGNFTRYRVEAGHFSDIEVYDCVDESLVCQASGNVCHPH